MTSPGGLEKVWTPWGNCLASLARPSATLFFSRCITSNLTSSSCRVICLQTQRMLEAIPSSSCVFVICSTTNLESLLTIRLLKPSETASCNPFSRAHDSAWNGEHNPMLCTKPPLEWPTGSLITPPHPALFVVVSTEPSTFNLTKPTYGTDQHKLLQSNWASAVIEWDVFVKAWLISSTFDLIHKALKNSGWCELLNIASFRHFHTHQAVIAKIVVLLLGLLVLSLDLIPSSNQLTKDVVDWLVWNPGRIARQTSSACGQNLWPWLISSISPVQHQHLSFGVMPFLALLGLRLSWFSHV